MKYLKRALLMLALVLCLTALLPQQAQAGTLLESGTFTSYPNLTWEVVGGDSINPQTLTISGSGYIPGWHDSTLYNGYPWDSYKTGIQRVVVEGSVTSVGAGAFRDIPNLKKVELGPTVTRIGSYAFEKLTKLETVIIEGTIQEMGSYAFDGCTALQNLTMPYATGQIYDYAFRNCTSLKSITIPEGVKYLSQFTFDGCSSLITVTIPSTLESIGQYAFDGCTNLSGVYITDLAAWCGIEFDNSNSNPLLHAEALYLNGSRIRDLVIPEGVTEITNYAFENITNLFSVTFPDSVTHIGNYSFADCGELETITFLGGPQRNSWKTQFQNVTATAYYPHTNANWTDTAKANLGGNLTWVALACKDGHTTVTDAAVPGTCLAAGKTEGSHCGTCGEIFKAQTSTGLGAHAVENGICTVCSLYGTCGDTASWTFVPATGKLTISGTGAVKTNSWSVHRLDLTSVSVGSGITSLCDGAFAESTMSAVTLPATLTELGEQTFRACTTLTDINIPAGVTEIGYCLFGGCYNLPAISLPEGITAIGDNAFGDCQALTEITLPESLTAIGDMAFGNCTGLTAIAIPAKVSSIGSDAFNGSYITAITFDGAAPTFNSNALRGITATASYPSTGTGWSSAITQKYGGDITWKAYTPTEGTCGENLTWTFDEATGKLTISGTGDMDRTWFPYETSEPAIYAPWYGHAQAITSVEIGSGVTSLGHFAFYGCTNLKTVPIPEGVTLVGCAFVGSGVTELTIPASVTDFRYPSNEGICATLKKITVDEGNTVYSSDENGMLYNKAKTKFLGCPTGYEGAVTIAGTVTEIGDWAFNSCSGVTSVSIPRGVTTIGMNAFWECTGLTAVTLPQTVTTIRTCGFAECSNLETITIPSACTSIGDAAFQGCDKLTVLRFTGTYPTLSDYAFDGLNATVYYPATASGWSEDVLLDYGGDITWKAYTPTEGTFGEAFSWHFEESTGVLTLSGQGSMTGFTGADAVPWGVHREKVTSLVVEEGITALASYSAAGMTNLTSISLPLTLDSIGNYVFQGCTDLPSVELPKNLTILGVNCFENCTSLTSVCLPDSVTVMAPYAFAGCTNLYAFQVGSGLTTLSNNVFQDCTSLQFFTIPETLTELSPSAFEGSALTTLTIPATVDSVALRCFADCEDLAVVNILGNTAIAYDAFAGVTATVYYPGESTYWSEYHRNLYPDTLTWVPYREDGCGPNLTWSFDEATGTLSITGTGPMDPFGLNDETGAPATPWVAHTEDITAVTLSSGVTTVGDFAFFGCTNLVSATLPDSLTYLGDGAFYTCGLTQLTVPKNVTEIGEGCFCNTALTSVALPQGLTTLGPAAFSDTPLKSVTIPGSLKVVPEYCFTACLDLTEVILEKGVTTIGSGAFDTTGLTSVSIPASVTAIEDHAFTTCSDLTHILFRGDAPEIGQYAFQNVTADAFYYLTADWTSDDRKNYGGNLTWNSTYAMSGTCGDNLEWEFDPDTLTLTITGTGDMYPFYSMAPCSVEDVTTPIASPWANFSSAITTISLPEGLTGIGDCAFSFMENVRELTVPTTVTTVGYHAFEGMSSLEKLTFTGNAPAFAEYLGTETTIYFPADNETWTLDLLQEYGHSPDWAGMANGIRVIGSNGDDYWTMDTATGTLTLGSLENTTGNCPDYTDGTQPWNHLKNTITKVVVEPSAEDIGDYYFAGFTALRTVAGMNRNMNIGAHAFDGCTGLSSNLTLGYIIGEYAFRNCTGLTEVGFSEYLWEIGSNAFSGCTGLKKLTFADSNMNIADDTFTGVTADAWYDPNTAGWTQDKLADYGGDLTWKMSANEKCGDDLTWSFDETTGTLSITGTGEMYGYGVSFDSSETGLTTAPWNIYAADIRSITVAQGVTSVGGHAFEGTSVQQVSLPEGLLSIGALAFGNCESLTQINIPDSVTELGEACLCGTAITSFQFPASLTRLGEGIFAGCLYLESVTLPDSITAVPSQLFFICESLESVTIHSGITAIGEEAFGCSGLKSVTIPATVKTVAAEAFRDCASLTSITLADGTDIAYDAFDGVTATVYYPAGSTFWTEELQNKYADTLTWEPLYPTSGKCGDNLTWSFDKATGELTVSGTGEMYDYTEDLTQIPWAPYYKSVTSVVIENGATSITSFAFYDCSNLASVSIPDSVTTVHVPFGANKLEKLVIPAGVTDLQLAFEENHLKFIEVASANTKYSSDSHGVLFNKDKTVLECYPGGSTATEYTVPEGVTHIGAAAFRGCRNLKQVTLPDGLKELGDLAFCYSGLTQIRFQGEAPGFGHNVFGYLNADIYYPANDPTWTEEVRQTYGGTVNWVPEGMTELKIVTQPASVTVAEGEKATVSFTAEGDGLTYTWYFKDTTHSKFYTTASFTSNSYSVIMTEARAGRQVYCVVTDEHGNTAQTATVTLNMGAAAEAVKITAQPKSVTVAEGATAKVSLTATGDGLSYQWYYKNAGSSKFLLTTAFTGNSYSVTMNDSRNGRQLYCVVSDSHGNSVQSDTVTIAMKEEAAIVITQQPKSVTVAEGEKATVSFTAEGEGLSYKWYFKDVGSSKFSLTTSFTSTKYSVTMTEARAGRQVYCVVTDAAGNTATTDTVTLNMEAAVEPVKITKQPVSVTVAEGATAKVSLTATGDGLSYQWYYKNAGSSKFVLTTAFTGNSYSVAMNESRDGRQLYCVVSDSHGNSVQSNTVTISMEAEDPIVITTQPKSVTVAEGEKATVSFTATGEGLSYQWYFKDVGSSKFSLTTSFTSTKYSVTMTEARAGRQVYCLITDASGNTLQTDTVTLNME